MEQTFEVESIEELIGEVMVMAYGDSIWKSLLTSKDA